MQPTTSCLGCGDPIPLRTSRCGACQDRKAAIPDYRRYRTARAATLSGARACWICHQAPRQGDPLEADHVLARAHGGSHARANLRPAHRSCNLAKGAGAPRVAGIRIL